MAIWSRGDRDLAGLVHHSDRGGQYLAIRYTERLADAGAVNSVGSKGDRYDNALAETVNGLYKAELIHRQGPWRTADQVEARDRAPGSTGGTRGGSTAACGDIPPAEFEAAYWATHRRQPFGMPRETSEVSTPSALAQRSRASRNTATCAWSVRSQVEREATPPSSYA